jgi:hypothetical protein
MSDSVIQGDVTIPAVVATEWANELRTRYGVECKPLADLLDPPKPTLVERVADMLRLGAGPEYGTNESVAEAILDAVLDAVEAMPLPSHSNGAYLAGHGAARAEIKALLRGESS